MSDCVSLPNIPELVAILRSGSIDRVDAERCADALEELGKSPKVVRCHECQHWTEDIEWCEYHSCFIDINGAACHPWESDEWRTFGPNYFCKSGIKK